MDPECEVMVLFISTTKWSIKVTSIDRRTPPNTSLTVYIIQLITIYSLPFILGNWDLRFESFGVYASKHATQCVDMGELAISTRNKIQLARYQLARESERLVVLY